MTEQSYRVIADRAAIGDKVDFETWDAGDLLVYRYPGRGNNPGELVRIERPVPTSNEPEIGPTVADLASRHCESTTGDHTCADDPSRSANSPYGATGYCYPCLIRYALTQPAPNPPTREQIAAVVRRWAATYEAVARGSDESLSASDSDMPESIADAVLALFQNGADQ